MITIESNTATVDEMKAAMKQYGQRVVDSSEASTSVSAEPISEQPDAPGGTPAEAPGGESAPAPEAGSGQESKAVEEKPLEPEPAVKPKAAEPEPARAPDGLSRGNFKSKIQKLETRVARLSDDLEAERGSKATLRQQLEEAKQQLAALQPKGDEALGPLSKPKRPTKAEFDFDEGKYDEALEAYDLALGEYHEKLATETVTRTLAERAEAERKDRERVAEERAAAEFNSRMAADKSGIDDYDEYVEALGEQQLPGGVVGYIQEAGHPAMLLYHFMKDAVNEGGKDLARITALSPVMQVREMTILEGKLLTPATPEPSPAPTPPPKEPEKQKPPESIPVRQKPSAQVPSEPFRPVGARAIPQTDHLAAATSASDYIRMRRAGVNRA